MIRARGEHPDGREFVVLGLSDKNLELLREGKPILVTPESVGRGPAWPEIMIMWGRTETELARQLAEVGALDEDTVIHGMPDMGGAKDHQPNHQPNHHPDSTTPRAESPL